jgi:hypothetical protein
VLQLEAAPSVGKDVRKNDEQESQLGARLEERTRTGERDGESNDHECEDFINARTPEHQLSSGAVERLFKYRCFSNSFLADRLRTAHR